MKKSKIIIIGILILVLVLVIVNRNKINQDFTINDPNSTYVIHGVTNYDRGSTYYLYKETDGKRQIILIDPESPVDLKHFTDRNVSINGKFNKDSKGNSILTITWIGEAD